MAWNNQLSSVSGVPDNGVRPQAGGVPPQAPPYGMDGTDGMGQAAGRGANDGFQPAAQSTPAAYSVPPALGGQPMQPSVGPYAQNPIFPTAPQQTRLPAAGSYDGQAILGAQPGTDSDQADTHDDIWIERTKRAIAETQNDPHRQVQLLQHLSILYLKERFNREVQADKG